MKRLIDYIIKNLFQFIGSILVSISFVFLIFPSLINLEFVKGFLNETTKEPFIGITALVLFFILYSWRRTHNIWQRYKDTYKLEKPPFIYLDGIGIFLFIILVRLIALTQSHSIPDLSLEFKLFAIINFILILVWFLSSFYWKGIKKEKVSSNIDTRSLSDEPIQLAKQDLLGREKFIEDLYKEIATLPSRDPFVFGLYGSWGEGKTSVINLLINKFKENEKFLIVNFDPWYFKDEEAILAAFYRQIERSISQRFIFPDLRKVLTKYHKLISAGISQTGIKIDLLFNEESLEEIKRKTELYIDQTEKKILIFVDDIDRLRPEEILLMFKLVRLSAKFKNTIFLLSFDPIVIHNYLKKDLDVDPKFLEKIVQKPVPLPAIEQRDIDHFLGVRIDRLLNEITIPKETIEKFKNEFLHIYQSEVKKLFKTLRHVKRYLNGLHSTLPTIKNEVNLHDFFVLEVIRIFYHKVFNDIWQNPWFYIPSRWSEETDLLSPFRYISSEDKKYLQIKEHIENVAKNEKEGDVLKSLLETIFFVEVKNALGTITGHDNVEESYRAEKRITHPESFRKYFMLKVSPLELSDEYVETTLYLWNSEENTKKEGIIEKTIFEIQKKERLLDFFDKLMLFKDKIQKDIVPDIVKVIYKNAGEFSEKCTENLRNSEYDKARVLILRLINDKIDKDKIQNMLEDVITKTLNLPLAVYTVFSCRQERGMKLYNIYDSIKIEELQDKVAGRLKKYFIDENRDIFYELQEERGWVFVLHQWTTNWGTFTGDNNKTVNSYIFSLIRDDVKKFIKLLIASEGTGTGTLPFNLDELNRVYNLAELQKLAEKFKNDSSLSKKEKDSIGIFLKLYDEREVNPSP